MNQLSGIEVVSPKLSTKDLALLFKDSLNNFFAERILNSGGLFKRPLKYQRVLFEKSDTDTPFGEFEENPLVFAALATVATRSKSEEYTAAFSVWEFPKWRHARLAASYWYPDAYTVRLMMEAFTADVHRLDPHVQVEESQVTGRTA